MFTEDKVKKAVKNSIKELENLIAVEPNTVARTHLRTSLLTFRILLDNLDK